jgi:hypothetical protein
MQRFESKTGSRTRNKARSQQARTVKRQTVVDPIPPLFVCALPDGPLEFGCGSWLTSRKSTLSDAVAPIAKGNANRLPGLQGK